jgi:hypothetical protein
MRTELSENEGLLRRKIRLIEVKAKCRHLHILTCKGAFCGKCLSEFTDWMEMANFLPTFSHVSILTTQLCDLCSPLLPISPSLWLLFHPSLLSKYSIYRQYVTKEGLGVISRVGDHILQEFYTQYLTKFRTYKIAPPPQVKNLGGEGASEVPFQVTFLDDNILNCFLSV